MTRFTLLFALALLGTSCSTEQGSLCGDGDEVTVDGESHCVYRYSVVVENGFECPPERPNLTQEGGIGICSEQGMLPPMEVERIGREYREISPGYEACVLDFECETGEACRAGTCEALNANNANNVNNTNNQTNNTNGNSNNTVTCADSGDCQAGEVCDSGVCVAACGGFAGFTCDATQWCDYPDGSICGAADQLGICRPRPDACTDEFDPVCGCDGAEHSNACEATAAGSDVASAGSCM